MYSALSFKNFFNEQISDHEIQQITSIISNILDKKYKIGKILLSKDILTSPKTFEIKGDEKNPSTMFRSEVVFRNYKAIFGSSAENLKDAEILKFEFPENNNSWFMIMLGLTQDNTKAVYMSFKPDLADYGLMSQIANYLKNSGYLISPIPKTKEEMGNVDFLEKVASIFRPASGLSFNLNMWESIYLKWDQLKKDYPKDFLQFEKAKRSVYGNGVNAIRKMDNIKELILYPTQEKIKVNQISKEDKVYYPLNYPSANIYFSQWSDEDDSHSNDEELKNYHGIISRGDVVFKTFIPVNKIVFGHRMFPSGTSTLVFEKELIVSHPATNVENKTFDPELICQLN